MLGRDGRPGSQQALSLLGSQMPSSAPAGRPYVRAYVCGHGLQGMCWRRNVGQSALSSIQDDGQNCALAMCGFKPLI